MKREFKRKYKKLTVWGNIGRTVSINLESNVPYEEPQDVEVDI